MDKKIINISRDIRSAKLLDENIPMLFNFLADQYHAYAAVKLVMHYETFYEIYLEEQDSWSSEAVEIATQINKIIKLNILSGSQGTEAQESILLADELRNSIMKRMSILTQYTDIFQIYEYVLNRIEYRFKEECITSGDDEFAKEVLRFIFDTEDNFIVNEKIKEIIGQLPIRMTKQKYFDLVKDSILLYNGADQSSLYTYLYLLRTSAMLDQNGDMETYYKDLWQYKTYLSGLAYKDLTEADFTEAERILKLATEVLNREVTIYYSLQEIINEVYALLLCEPYAGMAQNNNPDREKAIIAILNGINQSFEQMQGLDIDTELIDKFSVIEGVQEELVENISLLEDVLHEVDKNHRGLAESMMLDKLLNVLLRTKDLLSNSLFIDWKDETSDKTATEDEVRAEADKLINDLSVLFSGQDRTVSRAVMANTLNKIPVFFKDHKEVMDYVRYALEKCTDIYEKTACMEIINVIISE
ncbi:MAG: hypothetical protein K0S76_1235 [Herbinix sp.]|jgi:hypothetical protein|nr:hypothetical protein [Herbinix sp.]